MARPKITALFIGLSLHPSVEDKKALPSRSGLTAADKIPASKACNLVTRTPINYKSPVVRGFAARTHTYHHTYGENFASKFSMPKCFYVRASFGCCISESTTLFCVVSTWCLQVKIVERAASCLAHEPITFISSHDGATSCTSAVVGRASVQRYTARQSLS